MKNQKRTHKFQWTILNLLRWATSYFTSRHIEDPRASAEILLAHALKLARIDLYIRYDQPLTLDELARFKTSIKRRINKEPVAYIVGVKEFWSLPLCVSGDVLIPRPETECLVEAALSLLPKKSCADSSDPPRRILDLGTGSGAIAIALASQRPGGIYVASDYSQKAVEMAKKNAKRHHLDGKISFVSGYWLAYCHPNRCLFDMIISNPPYIPSLDIPGLQPEICMHEPVAALDGGEDGLCSLKHIIGAAHAFLNRDGYLLLEIGHDQKQSVESVAEACGRYEDITPIRDYSGNWRIVQMKKKNGGD